MGPLKPVKPPAFSVFIFFIFFFFLPSRLNVSKFRSRHEESVLKMEKRTEAGENASIGDDRTVDSPYGQDGWLCPYMPLGGVLMLGTMRLGRISTMSQPTRARGTKATKWLGRPLQALTS